MISNAKNPEVLIFVEHLDRELDSSVEIMKELSKMNLNSAIASIEFDLFDSYMKLNPKVVCLPYCKSENNKILRLFRKKNPKIKFINLHYEQFLSNYSKKSKRPRDKFVKNHLYHFVWGDYFKNYLIKNGVLERNIIVTGKPETFLLEKMIHNHVKKDLKRKLSTTYNISTEKKWVFFPLNDGIVFEDIKKIKKGIKRKSRTTNSLILKKHTTISLQKLYGWFKSLDKDFLDKYEIILRPHPSVTKEEYLKLFKSDVKIHIIKGLTIKEWILCSDFCISNYSSSLIDSCSIGIPSFIYEPIKRPKFAETDWIKYLSKIENSDKIQEIIEMRSTISNKFISNFINNEISPIVRTSKSIKKILDKNNFWKGKNNISFKIILYLLKTKLRKLIFESKYLSNKFINKKIIYDYLEDKKLGNKNV